MIKRYTRWLHTQWPAGKPERLPAVEPNGSTNVPGLYVVGDLTGVPLLKFSSDTGARVIRTFLADPSFVKRTQSDDVLDVVIIGAGVSGVAAAMEAHRHGLRVEILEASEPFSTVVNFPKEKPIYTYPTDMTPEGDLQFTERSEIREGLLDELRDHLNSAGIEPRNAMATEVRREGSTLRVNLQDEEPLRAHRVVVAIGRSGNHRQLNVPGETLDKVSNRLHDPKDFRDQRVLVVGGGDSALEAAIALSQSGADVTLSYRQAEISRAKEENATRLQQFADEGKLQLKMPSTVKEITADAVTLKTSAGEETLPNDAVFTMIGREAPLDFFRRSGVNIRGETRALQWVLLAVFFLFICFIYEWKNDGFLVHRYEVFSASTSFPNNALSMVSGWGDWWAAKVADRSTLIGTLAVSMKSRSFYYTLLYTTCIFVFGIARIRRRRTPYVTLQTTLLFLVQLFPLFLLPELILPWMGYSGMLNDGLGAKIADNLFPLYISPDQWANQQWPDWGHPRAYWHAYGFILAWPLSVYNVFTTNPNTWWLAISFAQTFVLIPLLIWKWGKGAYCGWICSCGALAETMGDTQRHKMPHGPGWNRLNMLGQFLLFVAFALLAVRIWGWVDRDSWANQSFALLLEGKNREGALANPLSWKWFVDVLLGGILGVGLYFKYSGRVWCRFACPLAALMHIYARFSRYRIIPEKKKCISCNVCTSVCHQGIDVMNFANRGLPMEDPECVRCSACVQECPTGVLQFGEVNRKGEVIRVDRLRARRD